MKRKEEASELEKLLKQTECKNKKLKIDDNCNISGDVYIPKIETAVWSGLQIPLVIFNICEYFKNVLSDKGLYSIALDFQIYNAATQFYVYNNMVMMMVDNNCPITSKPRPKDLTAFGEGLRHSLRELGITRGTNDRTNTKNLQDHNDPIVDMMSNINKESENEKTISRKK